MNNVIDCKGCLLMSDYNWYICRITTTKLLEHLPRKCPCMGCLVKGICVCTCEKFLDHIYEGIMNTLYLKRVKSSVDEIKSLSTEVRNGAQVSRENALMMIQSKIYRSNPDLADPPNFLTENDMPYSLIEIDQKTKMAFHKQIQEKIKRLLYDPRRIGRSSV